MTALEHKSPVSTVNARFYFTVFHSPLFQCIWSRATVACWESRALKARLWTTVVNDTKSTELEWGGLCASILLGSKHLKHPSEAGIGAISSPFTDLSNR